MATIEELQEALAQAEIELADKAFYVREFAAVCQERDALKAERDNLRTGWENSHRAEEELERAKAELHDAKIALDGKEVQIAGLKLSDKAIARELAEAKAELHDWKIGRYRAVVPGPEHCGIAHGVVVEPVRVPFTDDQIEKMAAAFWKDYRAGTDSARCIRAALAAGGIEPCPSPEYEPQEEPTGHVLRARLVEARTKIENQRVELARLNDERARLTAERDGLQKRNDVQASQLKEIDAQISPLMTEVSQLKAELAAARQTVAVPVKVRWKVKPKDVAFQFASLDASSQDVSIAQTCMDYLAKNAVIDVAGVPSVDRLAIIGSVAYANHKEPVSGVELHHAAATAIRDAVLAGIAAERQATVWSGPTRAEAEKKWNEINTRLASSHLSDSQDFRDWLLPLLPETRVEDGTTYRRNPANDGFVDMPTDAKVEALAMALCDAYRKGCRIGPAYTTPNAGYIAEARAAFAHLGAVPERQLLWNKLSNMPESFTDGPDLRIVSDPQTVIEHHSIVNPTDAQVEALAKALCDATCEPGFWDSPSCSRSTWTDAARAAFAHIGAVDSALEGE